jgi:hypothetical protein
MLLGKADEFLVSESAYCSKAHAAKTCPEVGEREEAPRLVKDSKKDRTLTNGDLIYDLAWRTPKD